MFRQFRIYYHRHSQNSFDFNFKIIITMFIAFGLLYVYFGHIDIEYHLKIDNFAIDSIFIMSMLVSIRYTTNK